MSVGACTPVVSLHTCIWSPHPNVSLPPGAVYLFRILSFAAELFLFIYAGVTMWSVTLWQDSEEFTKVRRGHGCRAAWPRAPSLAGARRGAVGAGGGVAFCLSTRSRRGT